MLHTVCSSYTVAVAANLIADHQSRSDIAVKVMEVRVVSSDDSGDERAMMEVSRVDDVALLRSVKSLKSLITSGLLIISVHTSTSPFSMATTADMPGRLFVTSWVQRSPTFRNLQASSTSRSSPRELSMIFSRLPWS
ncbi:unnamed protein product [Urochloa decumbens]|uniref:Uncharacterized protein n=1 Tax=Urochloa decumbens TaxID=240449 RepID=A0ABC9DMQ4_9POAL